MVVLLSRRHGQLTPGDCIDVAHKLYFDIIPLFLFLSPLYAVSQVSIRELETSSAIWLRRQGEMSR
jgi:hypothetical protein